MGKKRIGVLTSGGDCAGLNAAIRAITLHGVGHYQWEILGIRDGTTGLLRRPVDAVVLNPLKLDQSLLRLGGTVLGTTNKGNPFAFPMPDGTVIDRSQEIIDGYHKLGLDAMIAIGGDGSLAIMRQLATQGHWSLIGVPKTIDNDLGATENSIGYDTAVAVATEALDRLQPTAASHSRVMILEVMGRDAGHIALAAGIAGGADIILIPEIPYSMSAIIHKIQTLKQQGRNFVLVIVAEAVKTENGEAVMILNPSDTGPQRRYGGIGHYIGDRIVQETGAESRVTVLGHVQRGGIPTAYDRLIASAFGVHAVDLIAAGQSDRMVAWQNRSVTDVPLIDAIKSYKTVDPNESLIKTARGLGISMGDTLESK